MLLREDLVALDESERHRILADLASAMSAHSRKLRHELHRVREALRERFPIQDDVRGATRGLHVDGLLRVDANSFYVHGWSFDRESDVRSLAILTPEGESIELSPRAFRFAHADADGFYSGSYRERASGFACFFRTHWADPLADGWVVISRNAEGVGREARAPTVIDDPHAAREVLLSHLRHDRDERLVREHVHAAVSRIQRAMIGSSAAADDREFGPRVASPTMSIVVPVFGRIDLIEHQLARLAHDPAAREVELLYVLDSPELAGAFRAKAAELVDLYGLPLRCVTMKNSSGQAGAVNVGVRLARGQRVVLMHSDVVPKSGGWFGELATTLDVNKDAAIVGATLVYHDESIQHAGYALVAGELKQPHKGLHADLFAAASEPIPVDAVSTACAMLDREQFLAVGGLSGDFVAGSECDDVDLCDRLRAVGWKVLLLPCTRLYHLEGQSRPKRLRDLARPYDAWVLKQRNLSSDGRGR
jgi:GT2 family glycosyltransferase